MTVESFVASLSQHEKLEALEILWRSLTANPESFVSPDWHDAVVQERLRNPQPGESLNLQDAWNEIQGRRNARPTTP